MAALIIIVVFVFGVMGFTVNLFARAIFIFEKKQEGEQINWWWEAFITLAVPVTAMFAVFETMWVLGLFSHQDARFF